MLNANEADLKVKDMVQNKQDSHYRLINEAKKQIIPFIQSKDVNNKIEDIVDKAIEEAIRQNALIISNKKSENFTVVLNSYIRYDELLSLPRILDNSLYHSLNEDEIYTLKDFIDKQLREKIESSMSNRGYIFQTAVLFIIEPYPRHVEFWISKSLQQSKNIGLIAIFISCILCFGLVPFVVFFTKGLLAAGLLISSIFIAIGIAIAFANSKYAKIRDRVADLL